MDFKRTEATRYLCAAAHLDSIFREAVIHDFLEKPYKAVGPSHGIDASVVAKHCLAARRNQAIFDTILLILVIGLFLAGTNLAAEFAPFAFALFGVLIVAVVLGYQIRLRRFAVAHLLKSTFNPDFVENPRDPQLCAAIEELTPRPDYNVVIYSGFKPFVGSGANVRGFSFVLDLSKGKESIIGVSNGPQHISADELYNELASDIQRLALEGLQIDDRLYVNGKDIRDIKLLLAEPLQRPTSKISPEVLERLKAAPGRALRHYRCIRTLAWGGELVSSAFLRLACRNSKLFVELNFFVLCPIAQKYRKIDSWNRPTYWRDIIQLFAESMFLTVLYSLRSPFSVARFCLDRVFRGRHRRALRREVMLNPDFDYGAETTIRELGSGPGFRRYFQKLDSEMFVKLMEQQILDSLAESLDRRGIDTSEIRQRQAAILNNGVIVTGGTVSSETIAAGTGARAIVNRALVNGLSSATRPSVAS